MNYELLKQSIEEQGFNLNSIAKKLEISRTGLWQTIERETMTIKTLEDISKILRVDPRKFFNPEEFHPQSSPLPELEEWKNKYLEVLEENRQLREKR